MSLTISFIVQKSPMEVFQALLNVRGWWTVNLTGGTDNLNDEFEVQFADIHYSKQRIVEMIPGEKLIWLVTDSRLNFLQDKSEWTNTRIQFDIIPEDEGTELRFTHHGLVPSVECYNACSSAWDEYIRDSLRQLITTGAGNPAR